MTSPNKKKMGRPSMQYPRNTQISTKLTKPEADSFREYCLENNKSISDGIRDLILTVIKK